MLQFIKFNYNSDISSGEREGTNLLLNFEKEIITMKDLREFVKNSPASPTLLINSTRTVVETRPSRPC